MLSHKYKVVWCDGYARETVADHLIEDYLSLPQAEAYCKYLRDHIKNESNWWKVIPQEQPLWRGLEEFL